jgi:hypothetical protein
MADYFQKMNGMKTEVNFIHINNWGTFNEGQFNIKNMANPNHPEYTMFSKELIKLKKLKENYSNLQIFTNF